MAVAFAEVKAGGALIGEVRYENPLHAQQAMQMLNGSLLGGAQISVMASPGSQDGTKLLVQGIPAGAEWQELKDHFGTIGPVAFAQTAPMGKAKMPMAGFAGNANGGHKTQMGQMG